MESDDLFETLKYNVEIDQESIARQLEQVRDQIDLTMGSAAFSADTIPSATGVTNISGGIYAAPDINQISEGIQSPGLLQGEQSFWNNFSASLDQSAQAVQLGATRFTNDMRVMGLTAPGLSPISSQMGNPTAISDSFIGNIMGATFTSGHDRDLSMMTRADWRDANRDRVRDSVVDFGAEWGFTAMGTAIGAVTGGFGGAMTGATLGSIGDLALGVVGRREMEASSLGKGLEAIAGHNFGSISREESRGMAGIMQNAAYSFEGRATGVDLEQIQSNVLAFDNAGGFSNVTSSREMEDVLEGVVENARQFANTFKMKQEEAVQVMAQLQNSMVATTEEMGDFGSRMSHLGDVTGLGAAGITDFGMQGVNMMRGTGIPASQRFDMALEARTQAERLKYSDPVTRQLVQDAGGADGFALRHLESTQRFMMSGQGMVNMAALAGGGAMGSSIPEILDSAASFYGGDPMQILSLQANAGNMAGALGPGGASQLAVSQAYNSLKLMGKSPNQDQLTAYMAQQQGMSQEGAQSMYAMFEQSLDFNPDTARLADHFRSRSDLAAENDTGLVGRGWAHVTNFVADATTNSMVGRLGVGLIDKFTDSVDAAGRRWNNQTLLEGISLSDRDREAYRSMDADGGFDRYFEGYNFSSSDLNRVRLERGRSAIGEFASNYNVSRNQASNLYGLTSREADLAAAGSTSPEETQRRLTQIKEAGMGGYLQDILGFTGEFNQSLYDSAEGKIKLGDFTEGAGAGSELRVIAQKVWNSDWNNLDREKKQVAIALLEEKGYSSDAVSRVRNEIQASDTLFESEDRERILREAGEGKISGAESQLNEMLATADDALRLDENVDNFFKESFTDVERSNIRVKIREGDLEGLMSEYGTGRRKQYIEELFNLGVGNISGQFSEGNVLLARAEGRNRANTKYKASDFNSSENSGLALDLLFDEVNDQLKVANIGSETIMDLSAEDGAMNFIKREMAGKFTDKETKILLDKLQHPDNRREAMGAFNEIRKAVDDGNFMGGVMARTQNPHTRSLFSNFVENDTMSKLNSAIGDGFIRVNIQNVKDGTLFNAYKDESEQ